MALTVVIEGIDGSGKGTQTERLHERLRQAGKSAALISFPRYTETLFGRVVGEFLNGRFGDLEQVDPFLAALLYAGDRYESRQFLLDALRTTMSSCWTVTCLRTPRTKLPNGTARNARS